MAKMTINNKQYKEFTEHIISSVLCLFWQRILFVFYYAELTDKEV